MNIPNFFGLIRQSNSDYNCDMIGLPFDAKLEDLNNYKLEIVPVEYQNGKYWNVSGGSLSLADDAGLKSGIADVSKYDYVIFPCSNYNSNIAARSLIQYKDSSDVYHVATNYSCRPTPGKITQIYAFVDISDLMEIDQYPYVYISQLLDGYMPVIGIIED